MQMQADKLPPAAVLDTNVVLDGWFFQDPRTSALTAAIEAGRVRWLVCDGMRKELARVLTYPRLSTWSAAHDGHALRAFDRLAELHPAPPAAPRALRCSDADDQVFVDLALAGAVHWLVTHDRALLALRWRASGHGINIVKPADWSIGPSAFAPA